MKVTKLRRTRWRRTTVDGAEPNGGEPGGGNKSREEGKAPKSGEDKENERETIKRGK